MMLAKFMLNDMPHAAGIVPDNPNEKRVHRVERTTPPCEVCGFGAAYQCKYCGKWLCEAHGSYMIRTGGVCPSCSRKWEEGAQVLRGQIKKAISYQEITGGTCYEDAGRYAIKEDDILVHGSIFTLNKRLKHAWVETDTGYIWEPQSKQYMTKEIWEKYQPIEDVRYTAEEVSILVLKEDHWGPW